MLANESRTAAAYCAGKRRDNDVLSLPDENFTRHADFDLRLLPAVELMHSRRLSLQALMWEWQRRDMAYAAFAAQTSPPLASVEGTVTCLHMTSQHDAHHWGCLFAERADMPAAIARLFWTAERDPAVLSVSARPAPTGLENSLEVRRLAERVVLLSDNKGKEQLLVGSAASSLRLDICDGTLRDGPVALTYHVPGFSAAAPQLRTIALLHHLQRYLCLPPAPLLSRQIWHREISRLVAYDALSQGASQREIGKLIFGQAAVVDGWDGHTDRVRSFVRRVIRDARRLASGGYRYMLH